MALGFQLPANCTDLPQDDDEEEENKKDIKHCPTAPLSTANYNLRTLCCDK